MTYSAFISYSHADQKVARWLHHKLETYRVPRALVGTGTPDAPIKRRLLPVFRDRDELSASGDLREHLRAALTASRYQIVICSRKAAQSKWVNEEILSFKRMHGEYRTLALIADGEPYAGGEDECFPEALRFRLAPDGSLSREPAEPVAADIRPGKDGRKLALLKIIAGVTGARLDALVRRDAARRQRRLLWLTGISSTIAAVTIGLAIYAEGQRRIAEHQRLLADRSLNFLIGTFAIANPATDNPRTITALAILDRASKRAKKELRDEPTVGARLLRTTGEIYFNLGLLSEAERDLDSALERLPQKGEERARTLLKLSAVAYKRGDLAATIRAIDDATSAYPENAAYSAEIDAEVLERRGMAAMLAGKYKISANLLDRAAKQQVILSGDNREALGRIQMSEAQALIRSKNFAEADRLLASTVRSYISVFGLNHLLTAASVHNQALSFFEQGKLDAAEARMVRALTIYNRVLEPDHPTKASALLLMGRIRSARGDNPGAVLALDRARGIYVRLYGPRNAAVGDADFYAAEAEARAGKTNLALARLSDVQSIYDTNYGPDDPDQVELLVLRARVERKAGHPNLAGHLCFSAAARQRRIDRSAAALLEVKSKCAEILR